MLKIHQQHQKPYLNKNTTTITSAEQADDKDDVEEGPGEDDDEPGDIDLNDKED